MNQNYLFPKNIHNTTTSIALLILRVAFAGMLLTYGWQKLTNFEATAQYFSDMGGVVATGLVVFAEFFCALGLLSVYFTDWR